MDSVILVCDYYKQTFRGINTHFSSFFPLYIILNLYNDNDNNKNNNNNNNNNNSNNNNNNNNNSYISV